MGDLGVFGLSGLFRFLLQWLASVYMYTQDCHYHDYDVQTMKTLGQGQAPRRILETV